ncbi:MAG: CDP-2,3-bis-(O-geranylgeranyl)-sn-glycerol synthase [Candidatus Bilamarchaeaceae archaeon]
MNVISLLVFLIPIYIANSSPVLLGGGTPLDLGKNFIDGKRLLGNGKTIRGFIAGIVCGTLAGILIADFYSLEFFSTKEAQMFGALALSFGTMAGDSLGSFVKRRFGVDSGKPFLLDSMVFLALALLFVYPFVNSALYAFENLAFMFVLTILLHPATNFIANKLGLKNVPW